MKMDNEKKLLKWIGKVLRKSTMRHKMNTRSFLRDFIQTWCDWAIREDSEHWRVYHTLVVDGAVVVPQRLRETLKEYVRNRMSYDFQLFCDVAWRKRYVPDWLCHKWVTIELPREAKEMLSAGDGIFHICRNVARDLATRAKEVGGKFQYSVTMYAYDADRCVLVLPKGKKIIWKGIELGA